MNWFGSDFAGNIAEWVGAIGTAGALLLGFFIILRDRFKRERAQADRLVAFVTVPPDESRGLQLIVHNTSDQPIFRIIGRIYDRKHSWADVEFRHDISRELSKEVWILMPGVSCSANIKLPVDWATKTYVKLDFFDATSRF